jgi:cytochrome oxidase assembly protein ShyY1
MAMSVVLCALALGYWGVSRSFWVENRQALLCYRDGWRTEPVPATL